MTRAHLLLLSAAVLAVAAIFSSRPNAAPTVVPLTPPSVRTGQGPLTVAATLSSDRVLTGDTDVDVRVDLAAAADAQAPRRPLDLAVAIDHSGSMQGEKIIEARHAATQLIDQLHDGDHLAIVAFSSGVTVFPRTAVDAAARAQLRAFVDNLFADGSTNISGALEAAKVELANASDGTLRRIVLLSDGQPTVGLTRREALLSIVDGLRADGVSTSAFGVGLDFNGPLMQDLANHGGGNSAFIERGEKLSLALQNEVDDAAHAVARQVALELTLPEHVTLAAVPGRDFKQIGRGVEVPLYDFAPGQTAQVLVRLRLHGVSKGPVVLSDVSASFVDVAHEAPESTRPLALSVVATTDAREVELATHADVVELAHKADVNVQLREAERAYDSGDTGHALDLLDNIRRTFGMSADALAGDDLAQVDRRWRAGGDDGARASKGLTMKTMRNFGQNNNAQY
jgi:Ca-activated chloride channel family protein